MEAFSALDGLKSKLKSIRATDFAKQASNIYEVTEILREFELNQFLGGVASYNSSHTIMFIFGQSFGRGMNPLILPSSGLNSIAVFFYKDGFGIKKIHEG